MEINLLLAFAVAAMAGTLYVAINKIRRQRRSLELMRKLRIYS
jgi:hypothetical protein